MNASNQVAICLHGQGYDDSVSNWLTKHEHLPVFGHFVTEDHKVSGSNVTFSCPTPQHAKDHRLSDIARVGHQAASWSAMRHTDRSLSICMSIANKRTYELANNTRFDLVVCLEYSMVGHLDALIRKRADVVPGTIYAKHQRRPAMNNLWEIDTDAMMGTSRDMDTVSRFHHSYITGEFWQICGAGELDPSDRLASLGILLWKWSSLRNIRINDL